MKSTASILIANLVLTLIIAGYLLYQSGASKNQIDTEKISIALDSEALSPKITDFNENLQNLSSTIQRFNTSLIQYDFLKEEMNRLAAVDRTIGLRAQATNNAKTEENEKQVLAALEKLTGLSQQVKGQQNARRQTMLKLINGLERQLAEISLPEGAKLPVPQAKNPQPAQQPRPPVLAPPKPAPQKAESAEDTSE